MQLSRYAIGANQGVEADRIGNDYIVTSAAAQHIIGAAANQPVVISIANQLIGSGCTLQALNVNPELAKWGAGPHVDILIIQVGNFAQADINVAK